MKKNIKQQKKLEVLKKRITVTVLLLIIGGSWLTIGIKVRASMMTPAYVSPLLVNEPGVAIPRVAVPNCGRKASGTQCGSSSFKTVFAPVPVAPYDNIGGQLCAKGHAVNISVTPPYDAGKSGSDTGLVSCVNLVYSCADDCTGELEAYPCAVRFCDTRYPVKIMCGDGFLDPDEECEYKVFTNKDQTGLFGHSCADKGLCGTVKCDECKLNYSGCSVCPPVDNTTPGSQ